MPRDTLRHCYKVLNDAGYWWERVDIMQRHGRRKDFGGFADILCWHIDQPGVLAIQSCTESHMNPHVEKLQGLPRVLEWMSDSRRVEIWVWAKRKRDGRDKLVLRTLIGYDSDGYLDFREEDSEVLCHT